MAASLEKPSEHPLAAAIVSAAQEENIPLAPVTSFTALHGKGIRGDIQGETFLAGNKALLEEMGITMSPEVAQQADRLAEEGKTPLFFARGTELMGILAVADQPKATSAAAVSSFRSLGIRVVMLTGDNARTAQAVGRSLGVDEIISEVLPQDKAANIARLQAQGRKVAMVGDGINDAPALATADVGLAIGAGTDVAIESADIVLMKSDLMDAVTAVQLSKATIRNIKENLFWAFIYNIIGIPLAAGLWYPLLHVMLNPMFAAAAMSMSSVCVVSNALRLRFFKPKFATAENPSRLAENEIKGEVKPMTKTILIDGMMCQHCVAHVSKALNALPGVTATVDLDSKSATVTGDVDDAVLTNAVTEAGYTVVEIR